MKQIMLRKIFVNLKSGTEYLNYGRHIIREWAADHVRVRTGSGARQFSVLDLGCGHGTDLFNVQEGIIQKTQIDPGLVLLSGVENYPPYILELIEKGVEVHSLDVEHDPYPGSDGSWDILIANQVLEHTKEIFWIMAEAARILKPGGEFLVGVPNMASLHNRLLLLFGRQPTCIQSLSAHVRGFTLPDFKAFAEQGGFFKLKAYGGSNFYPFPPSISKPLSRLFPKLSWGIFFRLERTDRQGSFLDYLQKNELETPFYGGPANPAPELLENHGRKKISSTVSKKKSKKKSR
jgi:SAM-dependent methyltransferase